MALDGSKVVPMRPPGLSSTLHKMAQDASLDGLRLAHHDTSISQDDPRLAHDGPVSRSCGVTIRSGISVMAPSDPI